MTHTLTTGGERGVMDLIVTTTKEATMQTVKENSMQTMRVRVDDIFIAKRYRQDLGNVAELAASIRELGLLQPVVVTPDKRLVAGRRRLEAVRELGWEDVPAHVVDGLDDAVRLLRGEQHENICRKEFTTSEAVAIAEALMALEKQKAKERQREGGRKGGSTSGTEPAGGAEQGSGKLPEPSPAPTRTRDKVAEAVGMSGRTLEKAQEVVKAAAEDPKQFGDVVKEMDATGKVDPAHKKVKAAKPAAGPKRPAKATRPKNCNIKRLVKPIKTLVKEGTLDKNVAKEFAQAFDLKAQEQFIEGKDAAATAAAVMDWYSERNCVHRFRCFSVPPLKGFGNSDPSWHVGRISPEGRRTIRASLTKTRDAIDEQLAVLDAADRQTAPEQNAKCDGVTAPASQ